MVKMIIIIIAYSRTCTRVRCRALLNSRHDSPATADPLHPHHVRHMDAEHKAFAPVRWTRVLEYCAKSTGMYVSAAWLRRRARCSLVLTRFALMHSCTVDFVLFTVYSLLVVNNSPPYLEEASSPRLDKKHVQGLDNVGP